jgi:hypothetical protein
MHLVVDLGQSRAFRHAHRRRRMRRAGESRCQRLIPGLAGVGHGFGQGREGAVKQFPNLFISGFFRKDLVPSQHAARVRIHHEDWMVAGVQQYGIGGFGADAMQIEKFFPKLFRGAREQFRERAFVVSVQKRDKDLQPLCFLAEITGGANQAFEFC